MQHRDPILFFYLSRITILFQHATLACRFSWGIFPHLFLWHPLIINETEVSKEMLEWWWYRAKGRQGSLVLLRDLKSEGPVAPLCFPGGGSLMPLQRCKVWQFSVFPFFSESHTGNLEPDLAVGWGWGYITSFLQNLCSICDLDALFCTMRALVRQKMINEQLYLSLFHNYRENRGKGK